MPDHGFWCRVCYLWFDREEDIGKAEWVDLPCKRYAEVDGRLVLLDDDNAGQILVHTCTGCCGQRKIP